MVLVNKALQKLSDIAASSGRRLSFSDMDLIINELLADPELAKPEHSGVAAQLKEVKAEMDTLKMELESYNNDNTFDLLALSSKDLNDVLRVQSDSANVILDNAEAALKACESPEQLHKVKESLVAIYENCNFQDLSGQRISRVIKNLERYENATFVILKALLGIDLTGRDRNNLNYNNSNLKNGPEMLDQAKSQSDIDNLFG